MIITPRGPLDVEVQAPPSKSLTIRALAAAALARGRSALRRPLFSDDTHLMARALGDLGIDVARRGTSVLVEGCGGLLPAGSATLDMGDAGTPLRLMTGICCLGRGRYALDGSARMRRRPIQHLIDALRTLGVRIRASNDDGCPPIEIEADGFPGGRVELRGDVSSQYLSSLLMTAPHGARDLEIEVTGTLVSRPYVDLTIDVMEAFGARVERDAYRSFRVSAAFPYQACVFPVEGDASSASYFFAAVGVAGGRVRVIGISPGSKQGDLKLLDLMERMGCEVRREAGGIEIRREINHQALTGIDADLGDTPDLAPALAALAMFASGPTSLRSIAHLRVKESDRIEGMAACVRALGAKTETGPDYLIVQPPLGGRSALHAGVIDPRGDHRLAMAFAIAGLAIPGVRIQDPQCVSKSFPGFFEQIKSL